MAPTLLTLPPELQLMIAEHLPPPPLRNLSQTSAHLRSLLTCIVFSRTRTDALLHFAVTNNHPLLLRIALHRGAALAPLTPENQYLSRDTWAAVKYDNELLTMRLNASLDHCVERYTLAALHRAAHAGHADIVDVLLDAGADAGARTSRRDTALHVAAEAGHVGVVARLLQRRAVDVDGRGWKGCTALHYAAMRGDVGVASVLVGRGAGVDVRNGNGATPLHLAAWRGMGEVVELLVVVGAQVGVVDAGGASPLHLAAAEGAERVVVCLLGAGAEKGARDGRGWTPYDCAWRAGHGEMARRLLRPAKGANWRLLENLIRVVRR